MAGLGNVMVRTDSRGDDERIVPEECPDKAALGPECWQHSGMFGSRRCPYAQWFGNTVNRRREPSGLAAELRGKDRYSGPGVVWCELVRRNVGGGTYSNASQPRLEET